jgi:hypothetical protein
MYFSEQQMKSLSQISSATGLSISEIVRRAVDEYLSGQSHIKTDNLAAPDRKVGR